jgi:signal transduction histidine kinase
VAISTPDARGPHVDPARQLADYALAFDFLGKLSGATTETAVVENVFDLFFLLFAPSTMVYVSVAEDRPRKMMSRSASDFDVESTKAEMLQLRTDYAWCRSGSGFDVRIGEGPRREILRVEGVRFAEYRERYLNLALSVAPVLGLALSNARNFQLVRDEHAELQSALRAREIILAVVSHDLRNPVASILVNADRLEELIGSAGASLDEHMGGRARAIRRSAERMHRLIEDLLDIHRIEAGVFTVQKTECFAEDVMNEVLRDMRPQAEAKGVRIDDECPARAVLYCDRDRIVQVVCNLVGNALKFAPRQRGVITVGCEERESDVRFTVRDNGPGVRDEELPHVFDMYWQGREKQQAGIGLGLAIARGIVEAHEGSIEVESVPGEGATFSFTIPGPASAGAVRRASARP